MQTVCGLDVHKSMILMCILKENGSNVIQEFSTLTVDIEFMHDLMKKTACRRLEWKVRVFTGLR